MAVLRWIEGGGCIDGSKGGSDTNKMKGDTQIALDKLTRDLLTGHWLCMEHWFPL